MYVMVRRQGLIFLTDNRWEEECLFKYTMPLVCCYVEISQYVASIMFALISCLIGEAGEHASGGAQAERADTHDIGVSPKSSLVFGFAFRVQSANSRLRAVNRVQRPQKRPLV